MPKDFAGNTRARAKSIVVGARVREWIGGSDKRDYYKFELNNRSSFSLSLSKLKTDADISLLNGNGQLLQKPTQKGKKKKSIQADLEAGIYYLRVKGRKGLTSYTLRSSVTLISSGTVVSSLPSPAPGSVPAPNPTPIPPKVGSSTATAYDFGMLNGSVTYNDSIHGATDFHNYHKFSLNQGSRVTATLTGLVGNDNGVAMELIYDANNNGILDSGEPSSEHITYRGNSLSATHLLKAGTYFINIHPVFPWDDISTPYMLNLSATGIDTNTGVDPGNITSTAYNVGTLSSTKTYQDFVSEPFDAADYYKFSLNEPSDFMATVHGLSVRTDLELIYDADDNGIFDEGELVATQFNHDPNIDSSVFISAEGLDAGSYFLAIKPHYSFPNTLSTSYTLTLATPVAADSEPTPVGGSDIPIFVDVTAQEFLNTYAGKTISEGLTVKIEDGTTGTFVGDFIVNLEGAIEFGDNIFLNLSGLFKLDGESSPGSQLLLSEGNIITARAIDWEVGGNLSVKMNNTLTANQGNLIIKSGSQIQLEENISLQALAGSITLDAVADGDVQIKQAESIFAFPNIRAGDDITIAAGGDIQIMEGNTFQAGDDLTFIGTSEEGDIEILQQDPASFPPDIQYSIEAGGDIFMETNGDIQIHNNTTLYAGEDLTLNAKSEGDVQILTLEQALSTPRIEAGMTIMVKAEGDINIQRGDSIGQLGVPDIKAGNDIFMEGFGEIELEPGNWLWGNRTIHLETKGVEVQVQPRADVKLEAGLDIILLALEENAGIKVGEDGTLTAGRDIFLQAGQKDQGEGDIEVKENSVLTASTGSMTIASGLNGVTTVKENSSLTAGDEITIASGESGETVVKGDGTTLTADVITVITGLEGESVVEPDVIINAAS